MSELSSPRRKEPPRFNREAIVGVAKALAALPSLAGAGPGGGRPARTPLFTPSPPLQRKRGREQSAVAARRLGVLKGVALTVAIIVASFRADAADRIRLAVQRTGTLAWQLDIIKAHGLDRKADLQIEAIALASTAAG